MTSQAAERVPWERLETKITLGADTLCQEENFIQALRERAVVPHVSKLVGGNLGKNSLTEAAREDPGLKRVDWYYRLVITAYNLTRTEDRIRSTGQKHDRKQTFFRSLSSPE